MDDMVHRWLLKRWAEKLGAEADMTLDDDALWEQARRLTAADLDTLRRDGSDLVNAAPN